MEYEDKVESKDIQFAIFDGNKEITEAMYEEVKQFVAFVTKHKETT